MKKRKTRAQRSRSFRCPHCGAAMILRPASEIYHDAKSDRKLYVCHNYPACNTYVAAHPNTDKPMGVPANGNLRNLRIQAHRKFDLIWKNGIMTREEAYPATVGADYTIRDYRITVSETKVRSEMELIVLGIAEGLTFVD